jgi:hypothetical protein
MRWRCGRRATSSPDARQLSAIVAAHLGDENLTARQPLIETFLDQRRTSSLATDQLLNAVFLAAQAPRSGPEYDILLSRLLRPLDDARGRLE